MKAALADLGFLPVLLFWAAMVVIGRLAKNKNRNQKPQDRPPPPENPTQTRMPSARPQPPHPQARAQPRAPLHSQPRVEQKQHGGLMDELRRAMDELKRAEMQQLARERPQRVSLIEHVMAKPVADEQSLEMEEERTDYDDESARMVAERRRAPEGPSRPSIPAAELPAPATVTSTPLSHPLQRFADGSARGAFVLSQVLGRPRSELPPDA